MKTFSLIVGIITGLLLLSTLTCGLWIKANNLINDAQALSFHMKIGVASVIFGIISAALLIYLAVKR